MDRSGQQLPIQAEYQPGQQAIRHTAYAGQKIKILADGVTLTGAQMLSAKKLRLRKDGKNLVIESDDGSEKYVEIADFYEHQDVALHGADWSFAEGSQLQSVEDSIVFATDMSSSGTAGSAALMASTGYALWGGLALAGAATVFSGQQSNTSPQSSARSPALDRVDTTPPDAPVIDILKLDELSGFAEKGSVVTLRDANGNVLATTTAHFETGEFIFEPNPLGNGKSGSLTATDSAGNQSPSVKVDAVRGPALDEGDTTPPDAPVVTTSNGGKLSGTAEPGGVVTLKDEDGVVIGTATADPTTGIFTFEPNPLGDGVGGTLLVTDPAGNVSPPKVVDPVDATAPTAPVVTTSNGGKLSGTAEPGGVVTLKDEDDVVIGTASADPTTGIFTFEPNPLGDGVGGTLLVTDLAGNVSPPLTVVPVPLILGVSNDTGAPADGVTYDNTLEVRGSAKAGATIALAIGGTEVGTTVADVNGQWAFDYTGTALNDGAYSITAQAEDSLGNASLVSTAYVVIVDTTEAVTIDAISNDFGTPGDFSTSAETVQAIGRASAGASVSLRLDGTEIGTAVTDASGVWVSGPLSLAGLSVGASINIEASVKDLAGNQANAVKAVVSERQPFTGAELVTNNGFVIHGATTSDLLGFAASSKAGDLNGDGVMDLIVTAQNRAEGALNTGAAYVVFGQADGDYGSLTNGIRVIDAATLTPDQGLTVISKGHGDLFGSVTMGLGDINGDGVDDYAIGSSASDLGGLNTGSLYVFFGRADGIYGDLVDGRRVIDIANFGESSGFVVVGDTNDDRLGTSAASLGDINGDGINDLIVGAQNGDDVASNAGEAYVMYGRADGSFGTVFNGRQTIDTTSLSPSQGFILQGVRAQGVATAGSGVSNAGDMNGDGIDDIIVGSSGQLLNTWSGASAAYVIYGKSDGSYGATVSGRQVLRLANLTASEGFSITADAVGDGVGYSVASAGDVNGDGLDDLVIGAPGNDVGGSTAGAAYVIFGRADGTYGSLISGQRVLGLPTLAPTAGFVVYGDATQDWFGTAVSSAGDINGDGVDDLLIGAPRGDDVASNSGEAYVIFGQADGTFGTIAGGRQVIDTTSLSPKNGFVIQGAAFGGSMGQSVSAIGDLNGDGFDDLTVAAPGEVGGKGAVYVIYGREDFTTGSVNIGSTNDDVIAGTSQSDQLAGGDGNDTIIGMQGNDIITTGSGNDLVYADAGNDVIFISAGYDTLTLGRGSDQIIVSAVSVSDPLPVAIVKDFRIGVVGQDIDADLIDFSALNMDDQNISNHVFLTTNQSGTSISVDRDGTGTQFTAEHFATLEGINVSLNTLFVNGQIVI
jgi:hypothetical protein